MGCSEMDWPTPPAPLGPNPTYSQVPTTTPAGDPLVLILRARLVALVAALVIQGSIALLGVLPALPGATGHSPTYFSDSGPDGLFWARFAVLEFIAAVVVSLAFG